MKVSSDHKIYSDLNRYNAFAASGNASDPHLIASRELRKKIQSGAAISLNDVCFCRDIDLRGFSAEAKSEIVSAAVIALGVRKEGNTSAIDQCLVSFLNKNSKALSDLKFSKKSLELIIDKICQSSTPADWQASELLKKITKTQSLPISLREKAAGICLNRKTDNVYQNVTKAIDRSLVSSRQLPTSATVNILDNLIPKRPARRPGVTLPKIPIERASAYYNALKIKLESGFFSADDQQSLNHIIASGIVGRGKTPNSINELTKKLNALNLEYSSNYNLSAISTNTIKVKTGTLSHHDKLDCVKASAKYLATFSNSIFADDDLATRNWTN